MIVDSVLSSGTIHVLDYAIRCEAGRVAVGVMLGEWWRLVTRRWVSHCHIHTREYGGRGGRLTWGYYLTYLLPARGGGVLYSVFFPIPINAKATKSEKAGCVLLGFYSVLGWLDGRCCPGWCFGFQWRPRGGGGLGSVYCYSWLGGLGGERGPSCVSMVGRACFFRSGEFAESWCGEGSGGKLGEDGVASVIILFHVEVVLLLRLVVWVGMDIMGVCDVLRLAKCLTSWGWV